MRTLNGYQLLVIASRKRKLETVVWHYSTGNDDSVCGKGAGVDCIGYIDTDDAPKYKGCCQACARYVGKHGEFQGWDSENGVRYLSITNPKPEAHCAMHNKGVSQCQEMHGEDDGGFMETEEIPARKSNVFPTSTEQDTEDHFIGSGALGYGWWECMEFYSAQTGPNGLPWQFRGIPGYTEDRAEFMSEVVITHRTIIQAIRKIAKLNPNVDPTERLYVGDIVIEECKRWIFKGPDMCDFDAAMADEVMQMVAFGRVIYG